MTEQLIIAGFGGQGVMSMGQMMAYAGMMEDKEVSWLPSYGPEMRGGTAYCNVIVSDKPVASPIITKATSVIVLNKPSLDKFEFYVQEDGILLINSSLIDKKATRTDIKAYEIPANELAIELGNDKVANMIMLGAYLALTGILDAESLLAALPKVLGESKIKLVPINREALKKGAEYIKNMI